jgi:hypothetical protein
MSQQISRLVLNHRHADCCINPDSDLRHKQTATANQLASDNLAAEDQDDLLGVPVWNFDDTDDTDKLPVKNCSCGGHATNKNSDEVDQDDLLGVPVWNFDADGITITR